MDKTLKNLDYVDALKGWAVLGVVFVHIGLILENPLSPWIIPFKELGARGVQIFFILSAFTLIRSIDSKKEFRKKEIISFYIKRFFRIAPLFYLALIYFLWQSKYEMPYWNMDASNISAISILSHITFTNAFNPYWVNNIFNVEWAIAVEIVFYIVLPLLYYSLGNLRKASIFCILAITISIAFINLLNENPLIANSELWSAYILSFSFFPAQISIFAMGIVLYYLLKTDLINSFPLRNSGLVNTIMVIILILALLSRNGFFLHDVYIPGHIIAGALATIITICLHLRSP